MKKRILCLTLSLPLLAGCSGLRRTATDAAFGAAGGFIGSELSGGNPAAAAGGAVAGIALGEGVHALQRKSERESYNQGYERGRGETAKTLYWNLADQQRNPRTTESFRLYEVTIPEHVEDGVVVKPSTRIIRIQE